MLEDKVTIFFVLALCFFILKIINSKREKYSHKWRKKSSLKLLEKIETFPPQQFFAYIRKIDPFVFEEAILSALERREDIQVVRNKRYTGDNGVDGVFYIKITDTDGTIINKKCLIQAKRYKAYVNSSHIEDFSQKVIREKAHLGLFVHSGKTRKSSLAQNKHSEHLMIISGDKLIKLLKFGIFDK